MSSVSPGALAAYGWSERVATLYHSQPSTGLAQPGRVTRVERGSAVVIDPSGTERGYIPVGVPAVGDWVTLEGPRISGVLPRWSSLGRQDPDTAGVQVLASNIDIVLVTIPGDRANTTRAERELLLAWESGARPVLLLTKSDLAPSGLSEELATRLVGIDMMATSTETGDGIAEVAALLAPDRTGVLIGPSGAGKSSLTNALLGEARQATAGVRSDGRRGRHTTTARYLLALPSGGVVIDTPGLRSLGIVGAQRLDQTFPDIDELAAGCRFTDCAHSGEPGCAVTAAVNTGDLPHQRLASYQKLAREAAAERMRRDPVARRDARQVWKQRTLDFRRNDKRRRPFD
jgi:ribosome biogenesis GTPase / thiamine phosphate phosphatase